MTVYIVPPHFVPRIGLTLAYMRGQITEDEWAERMGMLGFLHRYRAPVVLRSWEDVIS